MTHEAPPVRPAYSSGTPASADEMVSQVLAMDEGAEAIDVGDGGYVSGQGTQVGFVRGGVT